MQKMDPEGHSKQRQTQAFQAGLPQNSIDGLLFDW